ncbi:hypothetical protein LTR84_000306 [Exophiala bonariae]|uniref:Inheritance of peroxisomes protein 1 n=1 Tax=Exophiala bonariae TaxID=1690606 RepID=A0AAV9NU78_9EURO|nr:hypothetical protein LTR84_000306 [Exophiala bonariae]
MAYPPSSYGDRPPLQGYRRSFTLPTRALSVHERAGLETADADSNLLFSHPSARVIQFSPPTDSIPAKSKETLPDADYPVDAVETLPWRSRTENLLSTGQLMIEKVRGSTYFLKSADQKVMHAIMRNSQCWCVDGESRFVLRIGQFRYYRIELPTETEDDKKKIEDLKQAWPKVLRYERTPCPFKRAFHVDLPDDAITPRRKGTWKRKQPPQAATPNTDPLPLRRSKTTRAWSLQGEDSGTPLQRYGRRGSDYGFDTSRSSSPRPPLAGDGYRSTTPSSLASSEDPGDHAHADTSSEDGVSNDAPQDEQTSQDHLRAADSDSERAHPSDGSIHLPPSDGALSDNASALESASDLDAKSIREPDVEEKNLVTENASISAGIEHTDPDAPTLKESEPIVNTSEETENLQQETDEMNQVDSLPNEDATEEHVEIPEVKVIEDLAHNVEDPSPELDVDNTERLPEEEIKSADLYTGSITHVIPGVGEPVLESKPDPVEKIEDDTESLTEDTSLSRVSSVASFHTTHSLTEQSLATHVDTFDSEKTPHAERFDPFSTRSRGHQRGLSEMTITASTVDSYLDPQADLRPSTRDSTDNPATPALARSTVSDSSWPDIQTPSLPLRDEGLRRRLKTQRSFSPLPPSTTLYSPGSPTHGNHFTAEILQKACNVALVKPMEAVVLLVHILARIAGGATFNDLLSGNLFRPPQQHRRRSSFPDQRSPSRDDTDDEDDFGVPLRGRTRSVGSKANAASTRDTDTDSMFDLD